MEERKKISLQCYVTLRTLWHRNWTHSSNVNQERTHSNKNVHTKKFFIKLYFIWVLFIHLLICLSSCLSYLSVCSVVYLSLTLQKETHRHRSRCGGSVLYYVCRVFGMLSEWIICTLTSLKTNRNWYATSVFILIQNVSESEGANLKESKRRDLAISV